MCYFSYQSLKINQPCWNGAVSYLIFILYVSNQQPPICTLWSWNSGQGILVLASWADQWAPSIDGRDGGGSARQQPGVYSQARDGSIWRLAIKIVISSKIEIKYAGRSLEAAVEAPQDLPSPALSTSSQSRFSTVAGGSWAPQCCQSPSVEGSESRRWLMRNQQQGSKKARNQLYTS